MELDKGPIQTSIGMKQIDDRSLTPPLDEILQKKSMVLNRQSQLSKFTSLYDDDEMNDELNVNTTTPFLKNPPVDCPSVDDNRIYRVQTDSQINDKHVENNLLNEQLLEDGEISEKSIGETNVKSRNVESSDSIKKSRDTKKSNKINKIRSRQEKSIRHLTSFKSSRGIKNFHRNQKRRRKSTDSEKSIKRKSVNQNNRSFDDRRTFNQPKQ